MQVIPTSNEVWILAHLDVLLLGILGAVFHKLEWRSQSSVFTIGIFSMYTYSKIGLVNPGALRPTYVDSENHHSQSYMRYRDETRMSLLPSEIIHGSDDRASG